MSSDEGQAGGGARGSGARRDSNEDGARDAGRAARATTAEGEPAHEGRSGIRAAEPGRTEPERPRPPGRRRWAALLRRVFALEALTCPRWAAPAASWPR